MSRQHHRHRYHDIPDAAVGAGRADASGDDSGTTVDRPTVPDPATICVVGLGYVGLPLATSFDAAGQTVLGFDVDEEKVATLSSGTDPTGDVGDDTVADSEVHFTADPEPIRRAEYVVVTVPTPIDDVENPNLEFVRSAGRTVGAHLSEGATVVLESTVPPGATESVLVPALEEASGYTAGEEFAVGYSPERASPGEGGKSVDEVVKLVGAADERTRAELVELYGRIVDAGVHPTPDVETAEAAKVVENVQRDLNIALMNELAIACEHMDLDTHEVLAAARTKWNFLDQFSPGLVGGHCIPVDPHFLAYRSELDGFSPKLVLQGREINEHIPIHTADIVVKSLNASGKVLGESSLLVLGLSYKPGVGDIRTSEVGSVIDELDEYDVEMVGYDPHADDEAIRETFDVPVQASVDPQGFDGFLLGTAHEALLDLPFAELAREMGEEPIAVDVPGALDEAELTSAGFRYRRL